MDECKFEVRMENAAKRKHLCIGRLASCPEISQQKKGGFEWLQYLVSKILHKSLSISFMKTLQTCAVQYYNCYHMWLMSTWNVASLNVLVCEIPTILKTEYGENECKNESLKVLYWLYVEMITWIYWAKQNTSLVIKMNFNCFLLFFEVANRIFKIPYLTHIILLLDSAASDYPFDLFKT